MGFGFMDIDCVHGVILAGVTRLPRTMLPPAKGRPHAFRVSPKSDLKPLCMSSGLVNASSLVTLRAVDGLHPIHTELLPVSLLAFPCTSKHES